MRMQAARVSRKCIRLSPLQKGGQKARPNAGTGRLRGQGVRFNKQLNTRLPFFFFRGKALCPR